MKGLFGAYFVAVTVLKLMQKFVFGNNMADDKVLSYNDTLLKRSDLDLLKGPFYLNDDIIKFYFSYISSCYQSNHILLVEPTISFWIANCQDPQSLKDVVQPLNLHDKQLIIFPVNDNDDVSATDGGTHWSLLVYYRKSNSFVHHDSMGGINGDDAMKLFDAIEGFVCSGKKKKKRKKKKNLMTGTFAVADSKPQQTNLYDCNAMKFYDGGKGFVGSDKKKKNIISDIFAVDDSSTPSFEEGSTPQQTNLYDCGLYVMAIAKVICQWYLVGSSYDDDDDLWFSAVEEHVDASVELTMRTELLNLIENLR